MMLAPAARNGTPPAGPVDGPVETLGEFLGSINWANAAPPPAAAPSPPVAALDPATATLAGFLAAVNWTNQLILSPDLFDDPAAEVGHRRGADRTVEAVLDEFVWD